MSKIHVYITPFDDSGNYADEIEVTDDVDFSSISNLSQSLDNNEFDVGIFRTSNIKLKLVNSDGRYSEADALRSIFKFKRIDSLCRITWEPGDHKLICGFFQAGCATLSEEVTVFKGLINDSPSKMDITKQTILFTVLGIEDVFNRITVPFSSISNGDSFETVFYTLLNQAAITNLLTVDANNISASINETIDDKSEIENKSVLQALKLLLLPSNSVLYIKDDTVYISPRDPSADLKKTFYGQASPNGIENIIDIKAMSAGQNRVLNYFTWKDTTELQQSASSVLRFGIVPKEINTPLIDTSSTTKINNIIADLRDEFADSKKEMNLLVPMDVDTMPLGLLDRISVDYPPIALESDEGTIPYYDTGLIYDDGHVYPAEIGTIEILASERFKILERKVNLKDEIIDFRIRAI